MPAGRKQTIVQTATIKHDHASRTFCKKFFSFSLLPVVSSEIMSFLLPRIVKKIFVYIPSSIVKPATLATPKHKLARDLCTKNEYNTKTHDSHTKPKDKSSLVFVTFDLCKMGYLILRIFQR